METIDPKLGFEAEERKAEKGRVSLDKGCRGEGEVVGGCWLVVGS